MDMILIFLLHEYHAIGSMIVWTWDSFPTNMGPKQKSLVYEFESVQTVEYC